VRKFHASQSQDSLKTARLDQSAEFNALFYLPCYAITLTFKDDVKKLTAASARESNPQEKSGDGDLMSRFFNPAIRLKHFDINRCRSI
jgi:hypothetical protein